MKAALPAVQVFVDSPLATQATDVFAKYVDRFSGPDDRSDVFKRPNLKFVTDAEHSRNLGRLLRHLDHLRRDIQPYRMVPETEEQRDFVRAWSG